ncbi:glycine betaine ABC transporter substrate-binding protein [Pengzhenrongella frigida]|uniref:Glycine/betaine ABC transporter substrate-binding protein n=1 Tax=Pengzhenrongella frigida TaxID=1259133 RepID=A0A4Q5N4R1_9MICO|nr:glycine betaine ABC transporter substrate-binding protein [Cellulomonas sp. HLT2-17]RYV52353.1 glycine/betaine ABC transporter substrate-binding protein [Cellulomonas sp. HLT2-17]
MRARRTTLGALAAAVLLLTAACGDAGSSGGGATTAATVTGTELMTCEPVAGDKLVVLEDDLGLQTVDNIVPAINTAAIEGDTAIVGLLDAVSATLDTDTLVALNKSVDVDRQTSTEVAAQYLEANELSAQDAVGAGKKIVVGAGNFSESATLAELYAGVLRAAGYDASTQTIGNRETYAPALESGELTIVPEYAGTFTEFLNKSVNGADAAAVASSDLDATMAALTTLGDGVGLTFGTPAAAQDQNAFAVTTAFAEEYDVATLSELAATCGGLTLGGPPECPDRPFCQPGLEETYALDFAEFTSLDAGGPLTKTALQQGKIAVGLVFSSDAALAK